MNHKTSANIYDHLNHLFHQPAMHWIITTIYTILIFSTLGIARNLTNSIRATGNLGTLTLLLLCLFLLFLLLSHKTKNTPKRLSLKLILLSFFLGLTVFATNLPEERIHVIEYGLLGWLIAWSFSKQKISYNQIVIGITLGWSIGFLDEVIQYILPSRVYDIRDVILNGLSATTGLLFFVTSNSLQIDQGKK